MIFTVLISGNCLAVSIDHSNEESTAPYEQWVEVHLNGKVFSDNLLVLRLGPNSFAVPTNVVLAARLNAPTGPAIEINKQSFYALGSVNGLNGQFDESTQTLTLRSNVGLQNTSIYNLNNMEPVNVTGSATGLFLNYDLNYARVAQESNLSTLSELGIFIANQGVFTSRFAFFDLTRKREIFRLDSQYMQDFPERMATLVIGDSQTRANNLTGQVYFGGVQWRTNFSSQPNFQPFPLPSIQGSASVPSTVDVYVDNILRARQEVEAGPFAINNLPVPMGQGNINMVVHDLLGREQLISQHYILNAQLLNKDVYDYSFEAGFLRKNFGRKDSAYEKPFVSALMRYGVTPLITATGQTAVMREHQVVGGSAHVAFLPFGIASAGLLASRSDTESGRVTQRKISSKRYFQFDHVNSQYGFSVQLQNADPSFWQLGYAKDYCNPTRQIQAQGYATAIKNSQISIGYLSQSVESCGESNVDIKSLNIGWSMNLSRRGTVTLGFLKTYTQERDWNVVFTWVLPLEKRRFIDVNSQFSRLYKTSSIGFQQANAVEEGWGYRLRKTLQDQAGEEVGANYVGRRGEAFVAAGRRSSVTNIQAGARAGLVWLGGYVRPTRWVDDSFALIEVKEDDIKNKPLPKKDRIPINVFSNNNKITQTDNAGVALIPRLVAYERNKIALDGDGVPIEIELDLEERIVTPKPRMGMIVKFVARDQGGMTLILHDQNDEPFPAGTLVYLDYGDTLARYEVGLRGRVFVPTITSAINVKVRPDTSTTYICPLPEVIFKVKDILPTLGPYQCVKT